MTKTIYVPEDDDEAAVKIALSIYKMAKGKQNDNRSQ